MDEKLKENSAYVVGIAIILAALLVSATIYLTAGQLAKTVGSLKSAAPAAAATADTANSAVSGQQAADGTPSSLAVQKEVTMDFLYADWCPHCQKMKPIVQKIEQELPKDRFVIRYWRDEDRQTNTSVAEVFNYYSQQGIFVGFPTFIVNGKENTAGEMEEAAFRSWLCAQFKSPKPSGC